MSYISEGLRYRPLSTNEPLMSVGFLIRLLVKELSFARYQSDTDLEMAKLDAATCVDLFWDYVLSGNSACVKNLTLCD